MQRHKSIMGSMTEALDFEYDSSSSNPAIDHQMCWSNVSSPEDNGLMDITCNNFDSHEGHNMNRWNVLEPGSSSIQNNANRYEDRQHEPNSIFLQNNSTNQNDGWFLQNSTSNFTPRSLTSNAGFVNHMDDDCQVMENPNSYKSKGSMNELFTSANCSSDSFGVPSGGTGGYLVEDNDFRPGFSLEGCRLSRKRKAIEENIGQSSVSGSSRWHGNPSHYIPNRNFSISSPSENGSGPTHLSHVNPSPDPRRSARAEMSQRNVRVRNNPPFPHDYVPMNLLPPTGNIPVNPYLDLSSAPSANQTHGQNPRALPQNMLPLRRNGGSSSRHGTSTSLTNRGVSIDSPNEEGITRNISRYLMDNPVFVPAATEVITFAQYPTNSGASSSSSSSQLITSSRVDPSSSSPTTWVHHNRNPSSSQYPRRLSDYVQRTLMSSIGSEYGGSIGTSHATLQSGALPDQGNNRTQQPRSALWMGRQGDGAHGFPHSLRSLAAGGEGRSRLASEIRSVLDLMRRSEGLRFEDVMILDQSMLFGVADVHDRHRDMRLDVDNMSYEELLALEERIGNVSTGLSEETVLTRLKQRKFIDIQIEAHSEAEPCSICREEYKGGEDLGLLECGHDFHTSCIKQWLVLKNLCPICKTEALLVT